MEKSYKLHGYSLGYKSKGKSAKTNQVAGLEFGVKFGVMVSDSMPVQQSFPPQVFSFTTD